MSIREQPRAVEGHRLTTPQLSDYGSVPGSDKDSRRSYKLRSSEGVIQIREKTS